MEMPKGSLQVLAELCKAVQVHQEILRDIVIKEGARNLDGGELTQGWWSEKLEELDALTYIFKEEPK